MEARARKILEFWFHGLTDQVKFDKEGMPFKMWFSKDKAVDQDIQSKFEADIQRAGQGEYGAWQNSAQGRLALIILLDQFTRNIYRNTPQMFQYDPIALELTQRSIKDKMDCELGLIARVFLYMPLQHSEKLSDQELSLTSFETLVNLSKSKCPDNTAYFEYSLDYSQKHCDIIKQFGRFPHRNAILNRPSTPGELEFLKLPGSSF